MTKVIKELEHVFDVLKSAIDINRKRIIELERKVKELDTRGSHFFLAKYWAEALALQDDNAELKAIFSKVSSEINNKENDILSELIDAQGSAQDVGGYYKPDTALVQKAMRPSTTLNGILESI